MTRGLRYVICLIGALILTFSVANASCQLVQLSTGQSNSVLTPAYTWSPNPNATIWNWDGVSGHIGTAYVPMSGTTINHAMKTASDVATVTGCQVRLILVAVSGQSISHWLPSTSAPDIYQEIVDQIGPALLVAGATNVSYLDFWQGEADANGTLNTSWPANFDSVITRFKSNTWFASNTPILVHQICAQALCGFANFDAMNLLIAQAVQADSANRSLVYSTRLGDFNFWDASNLGHMIGQGYFAEGALAANIYLNGAGRVVAPSPNYLVAGIEFASPHALVNGTSAVIASLLLPAGNWDVWADGGFTGPSGQSYVFAGISTSTTLDVTQGRFAQVSSASFTSANGNSIHISPTRFIGPVTVNLILQAGFTGSMSGYGHIKAEIGR